MSLCAFTVNNTAIKRAGNKGIGIPSKRPETRPKLNDRDQRQIIGRQLRTALRLPMKKHLIIIKLWCDTHNKISMNTFKYMKKIGLASYKAAHKPLLLIADTHKLRRLKLCMDKVF